MKITGRKRKRDFKTINRRKKKKAKFESEPQLMNSVNVVNLGTHFGENHFTQVLVNFEYIKFKFAATTLRIRIPPMNKDWNKKTTGLLYVSGNFIIVGATSEIEAKVTYAMYMSEIGKIRKRVFEKDQVGKINNVKFIPLSRFIKPDNIKTPNTVYKTFVNPKDIHLNEIHKIRPDITQYAPEIFPGTRSKFKNATYSIFQPGKCLILGLRNFTKILKDADQELKNLVKEAKESKENLRDPLNRYIWELENIDEKVDKKKLKIKPFKKRKNKIKEFEKRLKEVYDFGICIKTKKKVEDGIENKYRDTVTMSDFICRTDSIDFS